MRNVHTRIALPLAVLLAANVGVSAWVTWHQLSEDVASSLEGTAVGLQRILVAGLKESMRKNDREHVQQTLEDFSRLTWVRGIRVFDMTGRIGFSSEAAERGRFLSKASETCRACHRNSPPAAQRLNVLPRPDGANGSVLQAAEVIRADASCVECHKVAVDRPLGVLVVDLEMQPLTEDVKRRASRNLAVLLAGSAILLACLIFIVRRIVGGRLVTLAEAVSALRAGKRVDAGGESPVDEIDALKETLVALGTDLEDRLFSAEITRRMERALVGQRTSVLVLDGRGQILVANDEAQRTLGLGFSELTGRSLHELGAARRSLWERARKDHLAFHPASKDQRHPDGADLVLLALDGEPGGTPRAYLEVGRRAPDEDEPPAPAVAPAGAASAGPPASESKSVEHEDRPPLAFPTLAARSDEADEADEGEEAGDAEEGDDAEGATPLRSIAGGTPASGDREDPGEGIGLRLASAASTVPGPEPANGGGPVPPGVRPAARPTPQAVLPRHFLHHPYVDVRPEGDRFLRALVLLASLPARGLPRSLQVLEFDRTLLTARRVAESFHLLREALDDQISVCDATRIVRGVAEDFRRSREGREHWHLLLSPSAVSCVAHVVLLRQLTILLVQEALGARPEHLVVFVHSARQSARFFLGVWCDGQVAKDDTRWEVCAEIAARFGGKVELDPSYDVQTLANAHPAGVPATLGRGTLFVAELPRTISPDR